MDPFSGDDGCESKIPSGRSKDASPSCRKSGRAHRLQANPLNPVCVSPRALISFAGLFALMARRARLDAASHLLAERLFPIVMNDSIMQALTRPFLDDSLI